MAKRNAANGKKFYRFKDYLRDCFVNFINDVIMYNDIVDLDDSVKCKACGVETVVFRTNRMKGDKLVYLGRCNCCRHMQDVYIEVA